MVSVLSVVTSVTSSYLVSSSGAGLTNVLVTLASAGLSLCVTVQLAEVGALASVLAASLISYHHQLTSGPGDRLVHGLHDQEEAEHVSVQYFIIIRMILKCVILGQDIKSDGEHCQSVS